MYQLIFCDFHKVIVPIFCSCQKISLAGNELMNIVLSPNTNMKKYFCILCVLSLLYLTACDKKDVTTPAPMLDPILQEEHEKIDDHPKI